MIAMTASNSIKENAERYGEMRAGMGDTFARGVSTVEGQSSADFHR
jgi:hypothetical protein